MTLRPKANPTESAPTTIDNLSNLQQFDVAFEITGSTNDIEIVNNEFTKWEAQGFSEVLIAEKRMPAGVVRVHNGMISGDDGQGVEDIKVFVSIRLLILAKNEQEAGSFTPPDEMLTTIADAMAGSPGNSSLDIANSTWEVTMVESVAQDRPVFYHGGSKPVLIIDGTRTSGDGEHLCASASANVARRYGDVISEFVVNEHASVVQMARSDWMNNATVSLTELRASGVGAVIVESDGSFDFPADMLAVLDPTAVSFVRQLEGHTIVDDGHPFADPINPTDRGWQLYVDSVYGGDLETALNAIDCEADVENDSLFSAVLEGQHVGRVVEAQNGFIGQKIGRDPKDVRWHDVSKLKGRVPLVGEMTEISYVDGVGNVIERDLGRVTER